MSLALKPITTPIQSTALRLAAKRLASRLSVFVAGPLIEKGWGAEELNSRPASKLRLTVKDHVEGELQHEVIFGEHRGVAEMGDEHFGSQSSFAIAEMALVNDVDAIVIIPASAGSFCELGTWSLVSNLCSKMLIIADKQFDSDQSYLRLGTLRMAVNGGATVAWCDYSDGDAVNAHVSEFISRVHDKVMVRMVTRGD